MTMYTYLLADDYGDYDSVKCPARIAVGKTFYWKWDPVTQDIKKWTVKAVLHTREVKDEETH